MKRKLLIISLLLTPFIIFGFVDPYARRIRPFTVVPGACAENEVGYSMSLHNLYICTNTGYKLVASGTGYEVPLTFSTGLTRTVNTITVNTSQNIATLSNLTTNGFVKAGGGVGTLSIDTTAYAPLASPTFTGNPLFPSGLVGSPGIAFSAQSTTGMYLVSANNLALSVAGTVRMQLDGGNNMYVNNIILDFANQDIGLIRSAANTLKISNGGAGNGNITLGNGTFAGFLNSALYQTATNCSDSAGAAACGSAAAGNFVIDATTTSTVVSTTAVTANSQVFVQEDSSLGTKLGITCNTQSVLVLGPPTVTARTAGTSFTVSIVVGPTTNPACYSYHIIN